MTPRQSELELVYFAHRGRGDLCELLCFLGDIDLPVKRVLYPEYLDIKTKKTIDLPYGQLPVLCIRGNVPNVLAQTNCITRFTAKKAKLYPTDIIEACCAESVLDRIDDLNSIRYFVQNNDEGRNAVVSDLEQKLPSFLEDIEKAIEKNPYDNGWIVSKSKSFADIAVFAKLHEIQFMGCKIFNSDSPKRVQQLFSLILEDPKVDEFVKSRWQSLSFTPGTYYDRGPR